MSTFFNIVWKFLKSKWTLGLILLIILGVGGYFIFFHRSATYQFIAVKRGSITETVSLTGNTVPEQNVSIAFNSGGTISETYSDLGKHVQAGQVLAELDTSGLEASLNQAQANVDEQQATLEGLQSGAGPADVALYEQKYTDASSALVIAMGNSYLQSESAVLRYADNLFTNGTSINPTLNINDQSRDDELSVETDRVIAGEKLNNWKMVLAGLNASSTDETSLGNARLVGRDAVVFISSFLNHLGTITQNLTPNGSSLPQADIDTDRATINTASQLVSSGASAEQDAYSAWTSAYQTLISERSSFKAC